MDLLLDTHAFIWFINGDAALPPKVVDTIKNVENKCFISIASLWEIAIKSSLKKLELKSDFDKIVDFLADNDIEILPISFEHLQRVLTLEFHHRDPFDRIIISQALVENLTILSKDEHFPSYTDKILWKVKNLYANQIIIEKGVKHGIAGLDQTVMDNLQILYAPNKVNSLLDIFTKSPKGAYFFDRYCQFLIFAQFQPGLGYSMKISDFHNDLDLALDEYSALTEKGWNKEDRDKIMKIFQDIKDNNTEIAELVVKDPIP